MLYIVYLFSFLSTFSLPIEEYVFIAIDDYNNWVYPNHICYLQCKFCTLHEALAENRKKNGHSISLKDK